jgi:hypothetical protein
MLVTPLMELTAIHHSGSTAAPRSDPPIATGFHHAVSLYRPQAAPREPHHGRQNQDLDDRPDGPVHGGAGPNKRRHEPQKRAAE